MVEELGKLPLAFDPGTKWHYSVSTDVLGRLLEAFQDKKFGTFLEQRIFTSEMTDMSFRFDADKADRMAVLYSREGDLANFEKNGYYAVDRPWLEPAHRSLLGLYDMPLKAAVPVGYRPRPIICASPKGSIRVNWTGARILSPNSIDMMRRDQVGNTQPSARLTNIMLNDGIGFGLGFGTIKDQGLSDGIADRQLFLGRCRHLLFWVDPQNNLIACS